MLTEQNRIYDVYITDKSGDLIITIILFLPYQYLYVNVHKNKYNIIFERYLHISPFQRSIRNWYATLWFWINVQYGITVLGGKNLENW